MANPFAIEPANPLQALMMGVQGFDTAAKRTKEADTLAGRQKAMNVLQSGGDTRNVLAELIGIGDVQGAQAIAQYAEQNANRAFRETEAQRAQRNADRSFGLQERQLNATLEGAKVPPGFRPNEQGGLLPVPGGPADPTYIQQTTEAKAKPREFSVTDITKLSEEGGKYANLSGFGNTFKDEFAGYKLPGAGNVAMAAGRYIPSLTSETTAKAAQWWQGYDRFKNIVRNDLFGSALTANEQAAFERADINPGMDPKTIKENIKEQQRIARNGMMRKANALIRSGYDPGAIAAAYGLDLKDLGVKDQGRVPGRAPAPAAPAAPAAPSAAVPWTQYFGGQ